MQLDKVHLHQPLQKPVHGARTEIVLNSIPQQEEISPFLQLCPHETTLVLNESEWDIYMLE